MSYTILLAQAVDCTGTLQDISSPGQTNIDGYGDNTNFLFRIAVTQDGGFTVDSVGFNVTITRNLGLPTQIVQDGVIVNSWGGSVFSGVTNEAFFSTNFAFQPAPPLLPYGDTHTVWTSFESVTIHFECVSTAAGGDAFSQDFTFTTGDKCWPFVTATTPAQSATGVPLNQICAISIRDDANGTGVDGVNQVLMVDPGSGSLETVYDGTTATWGANWLTGVRTAAGNGFDFTNLQRLGGFLPNTGSNNVQFLFTTNRDLSTPVNNGDSQGTASLVFAQVAAAGMTFTPNPIEGGTISPSNMTTTYVDVQENPGFGNPTLLDIHYTRNGSGPSFAVFTGGTPSGGGGSTGGGSWDPDWSGLAMLIGSQLMRVNFQAQAPIAGGAAVIGDTINFTIQAGTTGGDPLQMATIDWVLGGMVTVTPTPANGATNQPQNVTWQATVSESDGLVHLDINSLDVTINGGPSVQAYNGTTFVNSWSGSVTYNSSHSAATINLNPPAPYALGDHVCVTVTAASPPSELPTIPPGPYCFTVMNTTPPPPGPTNPLAIRGAGTGPVDGGTTVVLTGSTLDTTACSDDFTSGTIGAMWTSSGLVTPNAVDHSVQFDTTTTPGSAAGLTTVGSFSDLDVAADYVLGLIMAGTTAEVTWAGLSLIAPSGTFSVGLTNGDTLRVTASAAGSTVIDQRYPGYKVSAGGVTTLRLVRQNDQVIGLVNGKQVFTVAWLADPVQVSLFVQNDATAQSRVVTKTVAYRRWPQISFGGVPTVDMVIAAVAAQIVQVRTPPQQYVQLADVRVVGCTTTEVLSGVDATGAPRGFVYTLGDHLVVQTDGARVLTAMNDPALKES